MVAARVQVGLGGVKILTECLLRVKNTPFRKTYLECFLIIDGDIW
jgi:hypothetical protein